jgi:uncharacterized membrane protein (UPF0127 family)
MVWRWAAILLIPTAIFAADFSERVELGFGTQARLKVEVARTPEQMSQGLMYRDRMDDNVGMLFLLTPEKRAIFWMANTKIPLSIAFLDSRGVILELYDMKPLDLTKTVSRSDRVAYALEVNQGWFLLNGVKRGDRAMLGGETLEKLKKESVLAPLKKGES